MHTKGPLDAPVTSGSVVGGVAWGLRNGFDVAPRGARAPHARPFLVTGVAFLFGAFFGQRRCQTVLK